MTAFTPYRPEARKLMVLGLPLIGSNLAQIAIGITDTLMLGWYDVEALAAVTLAANVYFVTFLLGAGFAWAVMPMVAEAVSAGEPVRARRVTRMGNWLSVLYGAVMMVPLFFSAPIFRAIGQEPQIAQLAQDYLRIAGWQMIPALIVIVLRSFLSALERTQIILWVTLGIAVLNVPLNYLLIFGNFGFPELGIRGAALASLITTSISLVALLIYTQVKEPTYELFVRIWRVDAEALTGVFRLGWPIGLTSLAEGGLFTASTVMMGWLGAIPLAAHGVALQLASLIFMVHVGLSQAATVRAGQALGRRDEPALRCTGATALALSVFVAALTVALFLLIPGPLIGLFIDPTDPARDEILAVGIALLAVAALFQTVDALQVMVLGLLRGVQDTRVPMWLAAVSYWVIGLPVSYVFGFVLDWGGTGIWAGLVVGLATAAVLLSWRFWGGSVRIGVEGEGAA